jgi:hypothetical protein
MSVLENIFIFFPLKYLVQSETSKHINVVCDTGEHLEVGRYDARRLAKRRSHARLRRLATKPGKKWGLMFRIGFQKPLGHAALT